MHTFSILALCLSLGYVTAQDSDCLSEVLVSFNTDTVNVSDVIYKRLSDNQNDYPVYARGPNKYNISVTDKGYVGFYCEACGSDGADMEYSFIPISDGTCFTNDAYGNYTLTLPDETGYEGIITLGAPPQNSTLVGDVTAQDCADYVTVTADESLDISGQYDNDGNDPPAWNNDERFIANGSEFGGIPGTVTIFNIGDPDTGYYLDPTPTTSPITCFPEDLNQIFKIREVGTGNLAGTALLQGPEPECAENVLVGGPPTPTAPPGTISGDYQNTTSTNQYPKYSKKGVAGSYMMTIIYNDGYVTFASEMNDAFVVYFNLTTTPQYKTCFPLGLTNQTFNVSGPYAAQVDFAVTLTTSSSSPFEDDYQATSLPNQQCAECKQVLDGPLQNLYELVSEYDPRCEDGCLYSNPEGREFCFEAGPDQVLLECPPGPGPIQTTVPN